ncbi:prolipoprotein diacylglyceryl transferase [Microbacter margulisiae]|uniref:Phosphatidylglycerol--prolipoprotein diacylglyceryl transferase n=1 Tax=Microbacter margulisiae TaxID=1350067 RepID=A0A7W5H269_9PORP|nr:prolipoprotein diacylglyceryl transferase [Microbacter margulisiae]MBB3187112.1 prolipoprotein diacylglyceryl transferase [Microbacter margulisiae]
MNLFIHWNVNPEIVKVFGISIRYYGILFVGGIILALFILEKMAKREGFTQKEWDKLTLYGLIGIIAGARLGQYLFYEPSQLITHPLEVLLPIEQMPDGHYHFIGYQGLASHGGALGLILALALFTWKTKRNIWVTLDLVAIVTPLSGFFIRMANLMNSEIYGKKTDVPWAFIFERVDQSPRHPSQIYEGLSYLFIFFLNMFLYKKIKSKVGSGFFFGLTIALIFTARFIIEFFKAPQEAFERNMTLDMGQWLSIPFVLIGLFLVWRSYKIPNRIKSVSSHKK